MDIYIPINNQNKLGIEVNNGIILTGAPFPYSGLTGYWKMNGYPTEEVTGAVSVFSGITWTTGINDQCASYTGTTSRIQLVDGNNFRFYTENPFSISFWYNKTDLNTFHWLISKRNGSNGIGISTSDKQVWVSMGNINMTSNECLTQTGVWYNIVLTYGTASDASDTLLYVNGTYVDFPTRYTIGVLNVNDVLVFGNSNRPYYDEDSCNGKLDEIGIWDRVLSPTEISYLYGVGFGTFYN